MPPSDEAGWLKSCTASLRRGVATGKKPLRRKFTRHGPESQRLPLHPRKQFVDSQISLGRYSSVSEYVRELIRADERRKAFEQLEAKLLEGLNSAESELTPADCSAIRKEALAQVEARKKTRWCRLLPSTKRPSEVDRCATTLLVVVGRTG
jgi:antitoxin ParD1/3/4